MEDALHYLESLSRAHPELSVWCIALSDCYRRESWPYLFFNLEHFVLLPFFQTGDGLIQLYHNFVVHVEHEMDSIKHAHLAVRVSHQYPDYESAINYLYVVLNSSQSIYESEESGSVEYIKMQIALFNLAKGDHEYCKKILKTCKTELDSDYTYFMDKSVYAHYHWAVCQYHFFHQDPVEFYKNAMLFLEYTSLESLPEWHMLFIAFNMSVSAMLGDNIYNFGELLELPIIKGLQGSPSEWIYHIIEAFNSGNRARYLELCMEHKTCLQPSLIKNEKKCLEKINIICLMEFIFRQPSKNRIIPFNLIAGHLKLTVEDVEHLLLKSLSDHLIEGVIDGVDGTVDVTWVHPRVLGMNQIVYLRHQLASWLGKVQWVNNNISGNMPT